MYQKLQNVKKLQINSCDFSCLRDQMLFRDFPSSRNLFAEARIKQERFCGSFTLVNNADTSRWILFFGVFRFSLHRVLMDFSSTIMLVSEAFFIGITFLCETNWVMADFPIKMQSVVIYGRWSFGTSSPYCSNNISFSKLFSSREETWFQQKLICCDR